jgi:hypothetical protein
MNSKLLAFRVARPVQAMGEDLTEYSYDPQTQTAVWNGTGRAAAYLYCTGGGDALHCNAYGPVDAARPRPPGRWLGRGRVGCLSGSGARPGRGWRPRPTSGRWRPTRGSRGHRGR